MLPKVSFLKLIRNSKYHKYFLTMKIIIWSGSKGNTHYIQYNNITRPHGIRGGICTLKKCPWNLLNVIWIEYMESYGVPPNWKLDGYWVNNIDIISISAVFSIDNKSAIEHAILWMKMRVKFSSIKWSLFLFTAIYTIISR